MSGVPVAARRAPLGDLLQQLSEEEVGQLDGALKKRVLHLDFVCSAAADAGRIGIAAELESFFYVHGTRRSRRDLLKFAKICSGRAPLVYSDLLRFTQTAPDLLS